MRAKYILFAVIMMTLGVPANAQKIKLIQATDMVWAGGIAGRHGINYMFEFTFPKSNKELQPNLIWLKGTPYKLGVDWQSQSASLHVKQTVEGSLVHYRISIGLSYNDQREYMQQHGGAKPKETPTPPKRYKGLAVLKYKYGKRTKYFEIADITQHLPGVNYP